ncbi:hypothetical protein PUNSTDRAFT_142934 [Punctularia strigosozonata HHB-11173 SS5]|uniref:uncharacterized protein n=1 Tax=Punctularia strigosozonata (strain HHB-11173) TaxID=741275 RepID=UPI000441788A|nr:uncharacterized protein PUNSTDRAFT_142934 [Punctularia strigosozonata HHB-11173 SS5]EIN11088.1 hypothetical protein PUNSTDRAFT_142934 [Punctularia strigosozonata HHB-11173 SS5]
MHKLNKLVLSEKQGHSGQSGLRRIIAVDTGHSPPALPLALANAPPAALANAPDAALASAPSALLALASAQPTALASAPALALASALSAALAIRRRWTARHVVDRDQLQRSVSRSSTWSMQDNTPQHHNYGTSYFPPQASRTHSPTPRRVGQPSFPRSASHSSTRRGLPRSASVTKLRHEGSGLLSEAEEDDEADRAGSSSAEREEDPITLRVLALKRPHRHPSPSTEHEPPTRSGSVSPPSFAPPPPSASRQRGLARRCFHSLHRPLAQRRAILSRAPLQLAPSRSRQRGRVRPCLPWPLVGPTPSASRKRDRSVARARRPWYAPFDILDTPTLPRPH